MTLRTITFDDSTHKLVPLEPTEDQLLIMHERNYDMQNSAWFDKWLTIYKSGIAAAPEYQEPQSAIAPDPRMNEPWTTEEKQDLNVTLGKIMNWNQDTKKDEL